LGSQKISRTKRKPLNSAHAVAMSALITRAPAKADASQRANGEGGDVRFNRTFTFVASLLLAAPHVAYAQDARNVGVAERARPEYDPLGMRFGGFQLNAAVNLDVGYSDNLFGEASGSEDDDVFITVRPEARVDSTWSRHAAYLTGGAGFRAYDEFSSEEATTGYLGAGGRMDITRDTSVGLDALAAREVESRTDPDSAFTLEPVEYDIRRFGGYVSHVYNRVSLRLSAEQTDYDYKPAGLGFDQNLRDRTDTAVSLRARYAITPRLSVLGEIASEDREYDIANASPDSEGMTYLVGAAFELSNLLRGEVRVGQFEREYTPTIVAPNVGKVSGAAVSGRVQWFVTPLTTVTVGAGRDVQESGYDRPYVNTSVQARVDHELLRNVILTGGVSSARLNFEGIDRDDESLLFDVGLRYLMNRRLSFTAAYVRYENESEGADAYRSFDENRVRFGVRVAL